jgi:hypothetical protein
MGVGVGERAETVIIFLTSRIPKSKLNVLAVDLNIGNVVLKNGGNVDLRVLMLDQERITQVNSRIRWRTGDDGS